MKHLWIVLSVVLFSACDTGTDQVTEIVIGLAAPLTGDLTRTGQDMRTAAELSVNLANESRTEGTPPFRLTVENTKSTVDGAEQAFKALIDQGTVFIVGPFSSSNTDQIIPLIDASQTVTIAPASAAHGLSAKSPWLFRSSLTVDIAIPAGITATRDILDYQMVGILTNESDLFARSGRDKFVEEVGKLDGVTIGVSQTFSRGSNDSPPDLTSQIQALASADPEIIFFFGPSPDRHHFVLASYELGLRDVPIVVALLSTADIAWIRETESDAAEGLYVLHVWTASSSHAASKEFVQAFQARYNEIPNDFHARTYAATNLLMQAITDVGPESYSNEAVRKVLADTTRMKDTIYGPFSFDSNGDAQFPPIIGIVRGNEIVPLGETLN